MPVSVYTNNLGASREQLVYEDMLIEAIKLWGIDVYYLPRTSRAEIDTIFGDDTVKYYDVAYKLDIYLESYNDYGGQQEFFSKFGLQIEKTAKVAIARRTFEKYVPKSLRNLPKEGDLIYLPLHRKIMEIRFAEMDKNFFQLGKFQPYMFALSLETFKYNGEFINTGIEEIDVINDEAALSTNFKLDTGGGTYKNGEIVFQSDDATLANSSARAIVVSWDRPNQVLRLRHIKGNFVAGSPIIGANDSANWYIESYNPLNNATTDQGVISDNEEIQYQSDTILDFTESNPFSELGTP